MIQIKVLLVEDSKSQQDIFKNSVAVFNEKSKELLTVTPEFASNLDEAKAILDGSFDGAILDLKLGNEEDGGNKIAAWLNQSLLRVPVIFVTSYPDSVSENPIIVKMHSRGAETYESDLNLLRDIKNTGLTHIMGGRGKIEETLNKVFLKNLLPQIKTWIRYGATDPKRSEKALLRHTLNHLLQLLDEDDDRFYPEEVYIFPPLVDSLRTGSIVKKKSSNTLHVVLNPACDLVIRPNGDYKTDRILLAEIDNNGLIDETKGIQSSKNSKERKRIEKSEGHNLESESYKRVLNDQKEAIERGISNLFRNTHDLYHHWLPQAGSFEGGFLNFRKLDTFSKEAFREAFGSPEFQISPAFVKDIVARFSLYYARQGQPDIDFDSIINKLIAST